MWPWARRLLSLTDRLLGRRGPPAPTADSSSRCVGQYGEEVAARHLRQQGYKILQRNVASRFGEIDIVASQGDVLCFVEVKTRRGRGFGPGAAAVTRAKQKQIAKAAVDLARKHGLVRQNCRFDVIAVTLPDGQGEPVVELYQGAFQSPMHYP